MESQPTVLERRHMQWTQFERLAFRAIRTSNAVKYGAIQVVGNNGGPGIEVAGAGLLFGARIRACAGTKVSSLRDDLKN
jgi:hypothetical protein